MEATLSPVALKNQERINDLISNAPVDGFPQLLQEMFAAWLNSDYFPDRGIERENSVFQFMMLIKFLSEIESSSKSKPC